MKVLRSLRNVSSDGEALIVDGKLFQAPAAATGKARWPIVEGRVGGTTSDIVLAEWLKIMTSLHLATTSETDKQLLQSRTV